MKSGAAPEEFSGKLFKAAGKNLPEDFFPVGGAGKILREEFSAAQRAAMMMQVVEPVA
ncbi:hypothetical protein [Nioella sp.]|jgi:hypothetical protein|uniref:hypothetical protein n=1 Tax=Nioella sp. TaxID=1912091 RepID=UPI0035196FA0